MKILNAITLLPALVSGLALAKGHEAGNPYGGHEAGNGGAVLDCNVGEPSHYVQLWDYYLGGKRDFTVSFRNANKVTAKDLGDAAAKLDPKQLDKELALRNKALILENLEAALVPLQSLDPIRHKRYLEHARAFFDEAYFEDNLKIPNLGDAKPRAWPGNCEFTYAVNQQIPRFKQDHRYEVNKTLWDGMDLYNQTGIVLHEVVYREAMELGQENSISAVYFNENLSSPKLAKMTLDEYAALLAEIGFRSFTYRHPGTGPIDVFYGVDAETDPKILQLQDLKGLPSFLCTNYNSPRNGVSFRIKYEVDSAHIEFIENPAYAVEATQDLTANNNIPIELHTGEVLFELRHKDDKRYFLEAPSSYARNRAGTGRFTVRILVPKLGKYGDLLRDADNYNGFDDYDCSVE